MEILRDYWAIVMAGVGGIAWLARLEGRSLANEKEIKRLWEQRREDLQSAQSAREETNAMLREIREDVRALRGKP